MDKSRVKQIANKLEKSLSNWDIKKAIKTLNHLGKYDFSQGIVVRDRKVLAIEGIGGTAKMLNNLKSKNFKKYIFNFKLICTF